MNFSLRKIAIAIALVFAASLAARAQQFNPDQVNWPTGPSGCFFQPGSTTCALPTAITTPNGVIVSGTTHTATCGEVVRMDSASASTLTLPAVSQGCKVAVTRGVSGGVLTIAPPGGATYDGPSQSGAPTNQQLAQGGSALIWTDGTNYHAASSIVAGAHCTWTPALTGNIFDCTGSGTALNVNGSTVSSPNLNGSTPAAGTNGKNILLQVSGSNITGELVGDGNAAHFLNGTGAYSTPASGSGSPAVIYASQISGVTAGVAVAAGSSASGTVDSASAINTAISGGNVDLEVDSGFALSTSIVLYSNTIIHCTLPQNGFIMQAASNVPVFVNAHQNAATTSSGTGGYLVSNQTDNNIKVIGCMVNANSTQAVTGSGNAFSTAHTTNPTSGLLVYGNQFIGVNGLTFSNNEVYDPGTYSIAGSNLSNVVWSGNYAHQPQPLIHFKNTGTFGLGGPSSYAEISGNLINAGDDSIELATEGCGRAGVSFCQIPNFKWGPIQHVHVEHNTFLNSDNGFRLLDASELIDDIDVGDTEGTTNGTFFTDVTYSALNTYGLGNIGKVNVHGWKVYSAGTYTGGGTVDGLMTLGANTQSLTISDMQYANPAATWPLLYVEPSMGVVQNLNLHGWDIATTSSTFSPSIFFMGTGSVINLVTNNFSWKDSIGTGLAFNGAASPTKFSCSNYTGRGQFNSTGFGGFTSTQNAGDCFTLSQTNGANNTNPEGTNFVPSTVNSAGLTASPSNPSGNSEKFEITGVPTGLNWPPSAPSPTFSPTAGFVSSGTTVTLSCAGSASPWISSGTTPIAGATGIAVSSSTTLYGACQGSGYFATGSAAYSLGFSIANSSYVNGTGSSVSTVAMPAFSNPLTANSLILVFQDITTISGFSFAVPTDTAGNIYTDCGSGQQEYGPSGTPNYVDMECFYAVNTHTTSSNAISCNSTRSGPFFSCRAVEILGANASSPIDVHSANAHATGGAAGSNNLTATSITPSANGEFIVGMFGGYNAVATVGTSPNSFSAISAPSNNALIEYFTQTTAAAVTATASDATSSDSYGAFAVGIKH